MFSNMKLSTKMVMGFGVLVLLAGVLGLVTWNGVGNMTATAELERAGTAAMDDLNRCAALRRDFSIHGFQKRGPKGETAADQWTAAYGALDSKIKSLLASHELDADDREAVKEIASLGVQYESIFGDQVAAKQKCDAAFEAWKTTGWDVTSDVQSLIDNTIAPSLETARETQDLEEVLHWSDLSDKLDKQVIQPFLLLRVTAVYLIATEADAQWKGHQAQFAKLQTGMDSWAKLAEGDEQLEAVAERLQGHFARYETAGQDFYDGILQGRRAQEQMAQVATEMVETMSGIKANLEEQASTIASRLEMTVSAVSLGAIILGIFLAGAITRSIVKPINHIIEGLNEGADQGTMTPARWRRLAVISRRGASEQASSLEETSSALEEMAAMTRTNAENAKEANNLAIPGAGGGGTGDKHDEPAQRGDDRHQRVVRARSARSSR
jgi:methyl-accepting chemotaxis protein